MNLIPCNVLRGAICVPELVSDPELARGIARNFGSRPTWVAATSVATFDTLRSLLKGDVGTTGIALRLGACRPDPAGSVGVVLAVQVGTRQVRCVAPLDDVNLQALLRHAAAAGTVQVALGPYQGSQCTVFDGTLPASNVRAVLELPAQPASLAQQAQALAMTAALCQRLGEVPSLIAGCQVEAADIAAVYVGGSPFGLDAEALARFTRMAGSLSPQHRR